MVFCELALKQPIPGKQLVLMSHASFTSAGDALMIEDTPDQKIQSKRKMYAPLAIGSKISSPAQLKMSINSEKFWQSTWHFMRLHTFCGKQPTIVLTNNKPLCRDKSNSIGKVECM